MANDQPHNVIIEDATAGVRAEILVSLGFNCHRLRVPARGQPVEVIWSERDFANARQRPSGSGIPVLFPFPGRLPGTQFTWQGRTYQLEAGDGQGNAIHGFVYNRPWTIVHQSPDQVTARFQGSQQIPNWESMWPADFLIEVTHRAYALGLAIHVRVENPDQRPLPCGLGLHPYFRVPLGGSSAEQCRVQLPVTRHWPLKDMLPLGDDQPWRQAEAFQRGVAFGELHLDDVFGGLVYSKEGRCAAAIVDPQARTVMSLSFDRAFGHCVAYNPGHRQAMCIEPYSCVPGAWLLSASPQDTGARVLQPGECWEANCWIEVRET